MKKSKRYHESEGYRFLFIYINVKFDFLVLHSQKVFFRQILANKSIKLESFSILSGLLADTTQPLML